jgi:hypothetical protein
MRQILFIDTCYFQRNGNGNFTKYREKDELPSAAMKFSNQIMVCILNFNIINVKLMCFKQSYIIRYLAIENFHLLSFLMNFLRLQGA